MSKIFIMKLSIKWWHNPIVKKLKLSLKSINVIKISICNTMKAPIEISLPVINETTTSIKNTMMIRYYCVDGEKWYNFSSSFERKKEKLNHQWLTKHKMKIKIHILHIINNTPILKMAHPVSMFMDKRVVVKPISFANWLRYQSNDSSMI
jgi:hypothetical protein